MIFSANNKLTRLVGCDVKVYLAHFFICIFFKMYIHTFCLGAEVFASVPRAKGKTKEESHKQEWIEELTVWA